MRALYMFVWAHKCAVFVHTFCVWPRVGVSLKDKGVWECRKPCGWVQREGDSIIKSQQQLICESPRAGTFLWLLN